MMRTSECVKKTVTNHQDIHKEQHADAQSCSDPALCKDVSIEARRGSGFDRSDAVGLCGGVSACESYLTNALQRETGVFLNNRDSDA